MNCLTLIVAMHEQRGGTKISKTHHYHDCIIIVSVIPENIGGLLTSGTGANVNINSYDL